MWVRQSDYKIYLIRWWPNVYYSKSDKKPGEYTSVLVDHWAKKRDIIFIYDSSHFEESNATHMWLKVTL